MKGNATPDRTVPSWRRAFPCAWVVSFSLLGSCGADIGDAELGNGGKSEFPFEQILSDDDAKADLLKGIRLTKDIALGSEIEGTFDPRARGYGYVFQAKKGAVIKVTLTATAGDDAVGVDPGVALDTVAVLHGPFVSLKRPGQRLAYADDTDTSLSAELPTITIKKDGKYLLAFSSWEDTGTGRFTVKLECQGTNFQCLRPVESRPCVAGRKYIQGGKVTTSQTWEKCEVVLLEPTVVSEGTLLTVKPGVHVLGNYLGTGTYGNVSLTVNGTLQAVGAIDQPVLFSAYKPTKGWLGLVLNGASNTLEKVFIEKASVALTVNDDTTLRGVDINNSENGVRILGGSTSVEDSVVTGLGDGVGIYSRSGAKSYFLRALVAKFGTGLDIDSAVLEMEDSTVAKNKRGIRVTGQNPGTHPPVSCPASPTTPPIAPTTWRDPVFRFSDITGNTEYGLLVEAPELVQVESCNIKGNARGVIVRADTLHPDSRIIDSNIYDNGPETDPEVETFHLTGTLNLSGNYWVHISDPELSASWRNEHSMEVGTCRWTQPTYGNLCTYVEGSGYICRNGDYTGTCVFATSGNSFNCSAPGRATWTSAISFTGFSPEELVAGPRDEKLVEPVKQARQQFQP
ncbi:MAG: hypothetical protein HYY84_04720 [Deltaproteobacteria bacterium]|nr:hypothetical protein [Deltaproteobacteria bacterium]